MKRFWLEIQIGLLVIVGVALVLAMGYLAYTGMSSILSSVTRESKPDIKLTLIQLLATDMEKAENSIRLYAFSRNEDDLQPYYKLVTGIDGQIAGLEEAGKDSKNFYESIDTISNFIEKKILIWNEMLPLYQVKQAEKYLDTITKELENKIVSDSLRKNRSIFKKIFNRQDKIELDEEKIVRDIEEVKEKDTEIRSEIRSKELRLAEANSRLTQQFYSLVKRIEENEYRKRKRKAAAADKMADETYRWIGWFSLSATLSLVLVIFVITRYIRKSHKYQQALVNARNEAENLVKAKEMFVANVSHELRTPMNVISGFIDQLLKRPQDEENKYTLNIIKSSSDHLVRIVNDILDFSKLESGKMKLELSHYRIKEVFDEMLLLFRNSLNEKNVSIELVLGDEVPEIVLGDPIRLKQILINLLGNAIKFTSEGSISIMVNAENQVATHLDLKIKITDTGIGIASDKLDVIFEDFTQAESGTTQKFGGTGLGLSIVKRLVDLHQGEIKVYSKLKEGTTFVCHLPYRKGKVEKVSETRYVQFEIPDALKSLHVLVVDDEVYNRKLVGTILKKWGISFSEADSGEQALAKLSDNVYHIILMDNRMPGMDGLQTATSIRKDLKLDDSKVTIVSFSAASIPSDKTKAYTKAGIHTFLAKPFTERELLEILLETRKLNPEDLKEVEQKVVESETEPSGRIDLNQLYRVAGDDEVFVIEMLEKFIESFDSGYARMVDGIERKVYSEAGDAAHKLASPCRHIGAEKLVTVLKEIEQESEEEKLHPGMKAKAEAVREEYEWVRNLIIDYVNDRKKNS